MFIPLSDENEDYEIPYVNYTIVFLCLAIFFVQYVVLSRENMHFSFELLGFRSMDYMADYNHLNAAGKIRELLRVFFNPFGRAWVQVVASTFLHGGFMHVAGNMLFLAIFGNNVEHAMGRARYLAFFILTGILAQMAQVIAAGPIDVICIGASGAISAVMGAYLVYYPRAKINMYMLNFWTMLGNRYGSLGGDDEDEMGYHFRWPAWLYLIFFFLTQVWMGVETHGMEYFEIAVWAHVGGFLSGVILAYPFKDPQMIFMKDAQERIGETEEFMADGKPSPLRPVYRKHRRPSLRARLHKGKAEMDLRRKKGGDWIRHAKSHHDAARREKELREREQQRKDKGKK
ncbi:MAG: rhomboid family intramembrane serine protease [Alphaproteobacteria bacterium]|nr:rhomboid family intramembrane serine protease [Alphaproteobacteria bacterium]